MNHWYISDEYETWTWDKYIYVCCAIIISQFCRSFQWMYVNFTGILEDIVLKTIAENDNSWEKSDSVVNEIENIKSDKVAT